MSAGGTSSITDRALAQVLTPGLQPQQPVSGTEASSSEFVATTAASQPTTFGPEAGSTPAGADPAAAAAAAQRAGAVPTAGSQAGSTQAGGLVEDGLPRTAVAAAGFATSSAANTASVSRTNETVAAQRVVDPRMAQQAQGPASQAPTGPAAWDEGWATKFRDAGAPPELIQQLTFTGAMGADAAQLGQMLQQVTTEVDKQLAQFATQHPSEFKQLRGAKAIDRGTLVKIASAVNSGQVKPDALKQMVEQAGMTPGKMFGNMFLKQMLPWMVIPGWGAIRFALSPMFGGKDPISKEPVHLDFWAHGFQGWMDAAMAVGGTMTVMNNVKGAMQVAGGHKLIAGAAAGSDIAKIAAQEGVGNLSGFARFKSYIPGTQANRAVAGIARLNGDLTQGISKLSGVEQELAQSVMTKWAAGDISVLGDGAIKITKMGVQPNVRGAMPMIGNRGKAMFQWINADGKTILALDGRMTGKSIAAHFASAGVNLADAGTIRRLEAAVLSDAMAAGKSMTKPPLQMLQAEVLGSASKQLLDAKFIAKPGGLGNLFGMYRPGPLQDAIKASEQLASGTLGKASFLSTIPGWGKVAAGVAVVGGGGYWFMNKQKAAAAKAAEAAAKEAAAPAGPAGQPGAAQGPADQQQAAAMQQMLQQPEVQQVVQRFKSMPPEQQAKLLQEENASLQQASTSAQSLPADKQQELMQRVLLFNILVQAAQQGSAGQQGAVAGAGGARETEPAGPDAAQEQAVMDASLNDPATRQKTLEAFASLPAAQRAQIIGEEQAAQKALTSRASSLPAAKRQELAQRAAALGEMVKIHQSRGGAASQGQQLLAGGTGAGAQAPATGAATAGGATFTAQGLGLAPAGA